MTKIFLIVSILIVTCSNKGKFNIIPLHPYTKENKFETITQKFKYFLLEGYNINDTDQFTKIRNFSFNNRDSDFSNYDSYTMVFYQRTKKTNREYRESESDLIEWHGKDIAYTFDWTRGEYLGFFAYKNGKIVNTDNIKIIEQEK